MLTEQEPFTEKTVFLWYKITEYYPDSSMTRSMWKLLPEAKAMVGYLRFIFLPSVLSIYLDLRTDDSSLPNRFLDANEIIPEIEKLEDEKEAYGKSIESLRDSIRKLDSLFELHDDKLVEELKKWAKQYTSGWGNKKYDIPETIEIFDSPRKVGEKVYRTIERYAVRKFKEATAMSKGEWLSLCDTVLLNKDTGKWKQFLNVLGKAQAER